MCFRYQGAKQKTKNGGFTMKILRLLRNIAALFILIMAVLALRPGVGVAHAKSCFLRPGYNCTIDKNGNCTAQKCKDFNFCNNEGCGKVIPF